MNYFKVNEESIVFEYVATNSDRKMEGYIETNLSSNEVLGKKWNGKEFEEVKDDEKEVKDVTIEDLDKKLDLIIKHLGIKIEKKE